MAPHFAPQRRTVVAVAQQIPAEARDVLINLSADAPETPNRFRRIIEIVGGDEPMREAARNHWRQYKQQGYPVTSHNL